MTWDEAVSAWFVFLRVERNRNPKTVESYARDVRRLVEFAETSGIASPEGFSRAVAQRFLAAASGEIGPRSMARLLSAVKGFFQFLTDELDAGENPFGRQRGPHFDKPLPAVFGDEEIRTLVDAIGNMEPEDIRDRTMIVLLYSTGLRVSELVELKITDIDFHRNVLACVGKRENAPCAVRHVARSELDRYINGVRPRWVKDPDCPFVFRGVSERR
jgi:integrase/recombinase XerD